MSADIKDWLEREAEAGWEGEFPSLLREAAAEIGRLRGEVAVTRTLLCQVYTDAYHAGHQDTVEGLYVDVLPVDRDTYWLEQVEGYAATPAPAMPNGVEGLRNALATLVRAGKRLRNRVVETRGFRCMDEHDLALDAADAALRAADNRDAAGDVPVSWADFWMAKGEHAISHDFAMFERAEAWRAANTPAAVPAGAAGVDSDEDAYVIERMGKLLAEIAVIVNGPEPDMTRWSYHDLPEKVRALKTTPAAVARVGKTQKSIIAVMRERGGVHVYIGAGMDVFGTPLDGFTAEEVERSLAGLVRRGLVIEVKRGFYTLPAYTHPPAAHPSACELEAVREALEAAARSLRTIAEQAGKTEGLDDMMNVRGYANSRANVAELALQHRGDSQEVGRG